MLSVSLEGLTLQARMGKSLCWARASSNLPTPLAWVGAALERGSSAYPHICPSRSSKLQKGDSPRRKSSRGKCSCCTPRPSSFGFDFPLKLSATLGPIPPWGTGSPSLGSGILFLNGLLASLSSLLFLVSLYTRSGSLSSLLPPGWLPLPQHL